VAGSKDATSPILPYNDSEILNIALHEKPTTRTPPAHEDSAVIFSSPAAASLGKLPSIAKPAARIDKLPFMDKSAAKIMGLKLNQNSGQHIPALYADMRCSFP